MNRSFNILVINWQDISNPYAGGAEVHFHEIFRRVAAMGHGVTLLCCGYKGAAESEIIDGIRVVRTGNRSLFNFYVPGAYRQLRKKNNFDLVIDDLNKIPFYTPLFVKEPLLALVHHFFGKSIFLEASFFPASYVYLSEKLVGRIYRNVNFAAVSESTRQELLSIGIRGTVDLLPNGVDCRFFRHEPERKSSTPLIGYLGRLKKYKSVDHLIRAFKAVVAEVPEARLLVVGDGDYRPRLLQLAQQLGIADGIEFAGHVSAEDKVRLLNTMWLAVNPSPKEGWGLTVIEANACGVPVVAADSPGLRDSVVDNKTGLLYPYGDVAKMKEQIVHLLINREKRDRLSSNAIKWAQQHDWDSSAQMALKIIENSVSDSEKENAQLQAGK